MATYSNAALTTIGGVAGGVPSGLYPTPVPQWLDNVKNRKTPLLQMITKASPPESTHNLLTWGYSSPQETFDTLAEPLDNSETGVDVDHAEYYQVGDVIQCESELMLVTAIASPTLTVIRGFAGTTAATHTDDYGISILGPAYRQNQDTSRSAIAQGQKLTNNWQQFEFMLDASHFRQIFPTFENLGKGDALRFLMKRLMSVEAPYKLEKTLIHSVLNDEDSTEPSTMNGIFTSTYTSNVSSVSGALTAKTLLDKLEATFLASQEGVDLTLMAHPRHIRRISSFFAGMRRMDANDTKVTTHIEKIQTPFGVLDLVGNPTFLKPGAAAATASQELDKLIIFDPKDIELVPASKDSVWHASYKGEPYTTSWQEVAYLRGAYSIRMGNPFKRTIITGYSTTDSDYPGMI